METEIYIISGFLGAGKTTLVQKLLKEIFQEEKVILIENDFGEISVDAALLKSGSVEVKEINSGCICCSLSGDFVKALKEVLERFHPDKIVIEPSGVSKLSDVVKSCSNIRIQSLAKVKSKITVVDVKRCKMYLDNFGEFFEDQIKNADIILLSHMDEFPDKVESTEKLIRSLTSHSAIVSKPWNQLDITKLLSPAHESSTITYHSTHRHEHCHHSVRADKNCNHDDYDYCDHNHPAEAIFETVTIRTKQVFSMDDLKTRSLAMEHLSKGSVLRAKGIVQGTNGYINLQYLPGNIQITKCAISGNMLCIIGQKLNRQELCNLFAGE